MSIIDPYSLALHNASMVNLKDIIQINQYHTTTKVQVMYMLLEMHCWTKNQNFDTTLIFTTGFCLGINETFSPWLP